MSVRLYANGNGTEEEKQKMKQRFLFGGIVIAALFTGKEEN